MFKKTALIAAAAASTFVAMPAAAEAQRYGYYDNSRYERSYRGDRYDRADRYYRGDRYSRGYDRRYDNRRYSHRRCSDGTTGTILGAVAGGLLGREVAGRRGDRTAGAIIGGAAGALAGRAIDRNC